MTQKPIVDRVRELAGIEIDDTNAIGDAADMLEFFFGQMQMHSPKMDGQHSYRFRNGWPMSVARGPTAEMAILRAMDEVDRERRRVPDLKKLKHLPTESES